MQFLVFITFIFIGNAQAAPIPATTSSLLVSEKPGIFRSPTGFQINLGKTKWKQISTPKSNDFISTIYRSEQPVDGIQPALTVRVDKLEKRTSLSRYTKRWMKDYPRLGFEILTAKKVKVGNRVGFMLDLINRDNEMQLRQLLFVKNKDVVNLTCRDHHQNFNNTLKSCNEIFRTFRW